jgi:two-component system response regulator PilR (NtrC family)
VIGLGDLPPEMSGSAGSPTPSLLALPPDGCDLDRVMNEVERRFLVEALGRTSGVRTAAARLLGITFRSLRYRLEKHGLDVDALAGDDSPDDDDPEKGRMPA